jgi:xanthine/uracil permease
VQGVTRNLQCSCTFCSLQSALGMNVLRRVLYTENSKLVELRNMRIVNSQVAEIYSHNGSIASRLSGVLLQSGAFYCLCDFTRKVLTFFFLQKIPHWMWHLYYFAVTNRFRLMYGMSLFKVCAGNEASHWKSSHYTSFQQIASFRLSCIVLILAKVMSILRAFLFNVCTFLWPLELVLNVRKF